MLKNIIHNQVREIKKEFKQRGIEEEDIILCFHDEGSFQNNDNSQRVWYFDKNVYRKEFIKRKS